MRIVSALLLTFFYSFSVLIAKDEFNINNFYREPLSAPFITFDPTYNTSFFLNAYNPNLFEDYKILDIHLNGSSFSPLGTYMVNYNFENSINDTLPLTAFEHNKGDYDYHENIIVITNKYQNNLSSFLMIQGKKQQGLQSINSNSSMLQNYFFNIYKNYPKNNDNKLYGSFSNSLMYHKDNIIIPTKIGAYSRLSDTYIYGLTANIYYSKYINLTINSSSQLIRGNHYFSLDIDEYVSWLDSKIDLIFNDYFLLEWSSNRKINSLEMNSYYNEIFLNEDFLLGRIKVKETALSLGVKSHYTNEMKTVNLLNANFTFYFQKINLLFNLKKESNAFLNRLHENQNEILENSNLSVPINIIDVYSIRISYENKFSSFSVEPFYLIDYHYDTPFNNPESEDKIKGLKSLISFKNNYFLGDFKSGVYSADSKIPLDFYSNYSILFAPKLEGKRFRPFIGISGVYMVLNNSSYIDFTSSLISEQNIFPFLNTTYDNNQTSYKNISLLNLEMGFVLNNFEVSYHWVNPFNDDVLFSFTDNFQSIAPFSKLQVEWQFLD